jgi:hypothetical protein
MATLTARVVRNLRGRGVEVYNHHQWGSKRRATYAIRRKLTRVGAYGKFRRQADTVVQHITVTVDHGGRKSDFFKDAQTVEAIGHARFSSGMSYNFLVDMETGQVAVGQPLDSKGTHTLNDKGIPGFSYNQNLVARAIAVLGQPGDPLSKKAQWSITQILKAMAEEGATTEHPDYLPHSHFAYKDCPCDPTRNKMPEIKKAAY